MKNVVGSFWWIHRWDILLGAFVFLLLALIIGYRCDRTCAEWDYVSDILLGGTNTNGDPIVWRWMRSPGVKVVAGTTEEVTAVHGAVWKINELLSDTGMKLRFSQDDEDIVVMFMSQDDFAAKSGEESLAIEDFLGQTYYHSVREGALEAITIWVRNNQPAGEKWGTINHELGHAVGLSGHTDRRLSSLFWAEFWRGAISGRYSSDDRKLLRFLYNHLEAGDTEAEVRAAFDRYWDMPEARE